MGCTNITSTVRFRGRLLRVSVCSRGPGGHLNSARVEKGRPLCLSEDSENWVKLDALIRRNQQVQSDIQDYEASCR